jgi:chorismate mutase
VSALNDEDERPDSPEGEVALDLHRLHIDRIDKTIVALIAERMRIGLELGAIKRAAELPTRSPARETEVIDKVRLAAASPLSPGSAERIFSAIIEETTTCQERQS